MITVQPKIIVATETYEAHLVPSTPIPEGCRTRFRAGAYECIPEGEDWPDEEPETDA